jgi:hypothetical protein
MKKIIKLSFLIISFFFLFISVTQANEKFISLGGGYTSFSENFASTSHLKATAGIISPQGIMYDLSIGYSDAKEDGDLPRFKMAPVLIGASYIFNPRRSITPYVGVLAGMTILPSAYNSPGATVGGKAGMKFRIDRSHSWFLEASYLSISEDKTDLDISPLNIGVGFAMNLNDGGKHRKQATKKRKVSPGKKKKVNKERKRRNKRRRRENRRGY